MSWTGYDRVFNDGNLWKACIIQNVFKWHPCIVRENWSFLASRSHIGAQNSEKSCAISLTVTATNLTVNVPSTGKMPSKCRFLFFLSILSNQFNGSIPKAELYKLWNGTGRIDAQNSIANPRPKQLGRDMPGYSTSELRNFGQCLSLFWPLPAVVLQKSSKHIWTLMESNIWLNSWFCHVVEPYPMFISWQSNPSGKLLIVVKIHVYIDTHKIWKKYSHVHQVFNNCIMFDFHQTWFMLVNHLQKTHHVMTDLIPELQGLRTNKAAGYFNWNWERLEWGDDNIAIYYTYTGTVTFWLDYLHSYISESQSKLCSFRRKRKSKIHIKIRWWPLYPSEKSEITVEWKKKR